MYHSIRVLENAFTRQSCCDYRIRSWRSIDFKIPSRLARILAFSESIRTVDELALVWGVRAHHMPDILNLPLEERALKAIVEGLKIRYLDPADKTEYVLYPPLNSQGLAFSPVSTTWMPCPPPPQVNKTFRASMK
jgi:hypothetical protein